MRLFSTKTLGLVFSMSFSASGAMACLPESYAHLEEFCREEVVPDLLLQVAFDEDQPSERKIAILAAVSEYPNLDNPQLQPAEEDLKILIELFREELDFDEVIVLRNSDFSLENLRYLFRTYVPARGKELENVQVVFAFSGHGDDDGNDGVLFFHDTETLKAEDSVENAILLTELKGYLSRAYKHTRHMTVLLNSCNGGQFLNTSAGFASSFGQKGSYVITAGGNEIVYHREGVGSGKGSVFFEMFNMALRSDSININGVPTPTPRASSGLISADGLGVFLRDNIQRIENFEVTPRHAHVFPPVKNELGVPFFVVDRERARARLKERNPDRYISLFGEDDGVAEEAQEDAGLQSIERTQRESNRLCVAPSWIGNQIEPVKERLEEIGYSYEITYARDDTAVGTVFNQKPANTEQFPCNQPFLLTVSEGPWFDLPILVGKPYSEAINILASLNLSPEHVSGPLKSRRVAHTVCESTSYYPVVASTQPTGGRVFAGDTIRITTREEANFLFTPQPGLICP